MAIRIRIGAYLLPVTFLAVICVELFACSPVQKHWQIYPDPGSALPLKKLVLRDFRPNAKSQDSVIRLILFLQYIP